MFHWFKSKLVTPDASDVSNDYTRYANEATSRLASAENKIIELSEKLYAAEEEMQAAQLVFTKQVEDLTLSHRDKIEKMTAEHNEMKAQYEEKLADANRNEFLVMQFKARTESAAIQTEIIRDHLRETVALTAALHSTILDDDSCWPAKTPDDTSPQKEPVFGLNIDLIKQATDDMGPPRL